MAGMSLLLENVNVITLFAEDLAGTKSFCEEVLGLQVLGEYEGSGVLKLGNVMVKGCQPSVDVCLGRSTATSVAAR